MTTIHDVARESGVSIATVSRTLNGSARVSESTRTKVLAAAHRLDFRPNPAARGLVTGRLGTVGVLVPDLTNPFYGRVLGGIAHAAQQSGFGVFLADSREVPGEEPELVARLSQRVDGLVLVSARMPEVELLAAAARRPVVLVNRIVDRIDGVAVDAWQGMADLLEHLAREGHRRVLYLDGPPASRNGAEKLAGLSAAARRHGVELLPGGHHRPTFSVGRSAAEQVLGTDATAVVAYSDVLAWGLLSRLQELGVDVPGQLSVAGFDDSLEEGMARPALTTVATRAHDMGAAAAQMLERCLANGHLTALHELLPCTVVVRGSTGAPRP